LNIRSEKQGSILRRIAEGTLTLSSKKEYKDLLTLFPDKADVQRAYADFLAQQEEDKTAYDYYLSAGNLYIQDGKTFQAIVSKILAWRIVKPTHQEGRSFHTALQASPFRESPLQLFFAELPYPEFIAIMLKLVRVRIPAGEIVLNAGDTCDNLYFIVSGILQETLLSDSEAPPSSSSKVSQGLSDNDIFGDVFPLSRINYSRSVVITRTSVELVKISKSALKDLCEQYPLIEELLAGLYKHPGDADQIRTWASVRRSPRHMTPIKITLKITPPKQSEHIINIEAMSKDISMGGLCADLGLKYVSLQIKEIIGSRAVIDVDLPHSGKSLGINGTVVWGKHLEEPGGTSIIVGIKFKSLGQEKQDLLNVYCFGIDNEEALMWSLWENYMG
jgi:hypothetical protein